MRKVTILLNWLILIFFVTIAFMAVSKEGVGIYFLGTGIGMAILGSPFFISLRALNKRTPEYVKSAITANYAVGGFLVLLILYGIVISEPFTFLPLVIVIMVPTFLNIRLLKAN